MDIEIKLAAARTKLILDKPFLGALVLRLPLVKADPKWCRSTGTDAKKLYYNANYVDALDLDQLQFVLAHEALHCALSHFVRRQHRNKHRWDLACDNAINPLLLSDGLKPPVGVWVDKSFEGMTAEEIYPYIDENNTDEPMDQHIYDGEEQTGNDHDKGVDDPSESRDSPDSGDNGNDQDDGESDGEQDSDNGDESGDGNNDSQPQEIGDDPGEDRPPPLSPSERDSLSVQWQQRMAGAAQQAMQAGKLGGAMARLIDHMLQPQLPWRMLLARYMTAVARDDYSYMRPSRREGEAILPTLRSSQLNVVVAIDTSGSISARELGEFVSEVDAIKGQMRARVTLIACDSELVPGGPWIYEPWEEITLPQQLSGGGGTSFEPVFEWVANQDQQPDLLLYFTDAEGSFPNIEPNFQVLWLVKGKHKIPWGQRVQLN